MAALSILYVEDNRDVRETVCELLESETREITAVGDGEAAFEAWQARVFDVLITDISLPGIPGTELARRVLAVRPQQWVVFCSGYEYRDAIGAMGPNVRAIPKAFEYEDMDALMNQIAFALGRPGSAPG